MPVVYHADKRIGSQVIGGILPRALTSGPCDLPTMPLSSLKVRTALALQLPVDGNQVARLYMTQITACRQKKLLA
jgi:hypothetical protein